MTTKEQQFFEQLYTRYYEKLYQFIARLIRDPDSAYDLVQDTFTRAYTRTDELMRHPNSAGWLFTAARYEAMNHLRLKRNRELNSDPLTELTEGSQAAEDAVLEAFFPIEALRKLLKEEDIELLLDRFEKGYSVEETAKAHALTYAACKMRLSRIYHKLRRHPEIFGLLLILMEVYR